MIFVFDIGSKILILFLAIGWPIAFYLISNWTSPHGYEPKNYKSAFVLATLETFKYFLYAFSVLSLITLIYWLFITFV